MKKWWKTQLTLGDETVPGGRGAPRAPNYWWRNLIRLYRRALLYSRKRHSAEYKVAPEAWFLIIIPGGIVTAWEKLRQCRRHREAKMQSVYSPVNLQARAAEEQETWKIMKFSILPRNGAMLYNLIFRAEKPRKMGSVLKDQESRSGQKPTCMSIGPAHLRQTGVIFRR